MTQRYQTMIGFGGAFTDAAGINMNALSIATLNNFMNSYFAENGRTLALVLRHQSVQDCGIR